jgi:predicted nucleotidyltransferase
MLEGNKNITPVIAHVLELIKNALLAHTPAEAIYLFGSYAYGTPTRDSDLDICAVIPDSDVDTAFLSGDIRYDLTLTTKKPMDLILTKKSSFAKRSAWNISIENTVAHKGELLYAK